MKACVLHGINDLRYEDVPKPIRKSGEVLIKIMASGICGSDIPRVFTKGTYQFPTIPGHEFSGRIEEADDPNNIGKKVAVFPLVPCMKCSACETGNYAQCSDYNYFGSRCDGGFAQYICVPLWNVVFADDELSFEEIAMCEPCSVALHAIEQANLKVGASVAVFGAGPIGILIGKIAKLKGAGTGFLIDINLKKTAFAKKMGFFTVLNQSVDISIEAAGVSQALEQALLATKPNGTVVAMGNPSGDMVLSQKSYWEILRKELVIKGTWNSRYNQSQNDWKMSLSIMKELNIKELISHKLSLSKCNHAFGFMKENKEFFNKVMFVEDEIWKN